MINFVSPLSVGDSVKRRKNHIIRRVSAGKTCRKVFLITDPTNPENLYDIIETQLLRLPMYREKDTLVYGIAGSNDEAKELLPEILKEKIC